MKFLVIGNGGREHAIAHQLHQSSHVEKIYFSGDGVPGLDPIAQANKISQNSGDDLARFARENHIDYTIVGPEQPLADGLTDLFREKGLKIFGPDKSGARMESSKVFAKDFMKKYNIPTAAYEVFDHYQTALSYSENLNYPIVIKADGLAAGKGAVVVENRDQAQRVLNEMMVENKFDLAGKQVVIEEFLKGQEISILAVCDGGSYQLLSPSQDHKQALDGDKGPNTGGMGAYAPVPFAGNELLKTIKDKIISPTLKGLKSEGVAYTGILYAGLMITPRGPKVIEFNCRMGDPETQVVLPLLKTDFAEIIAAACEGRLNEIKIENDPDRSALITILASKGYPGAYEKGKVITGLESIEDPAVNCFHAGTAYGPDGSIVTNGGRVLGVAASSFDLPSAFHLVYENIRQVHFDGMYYRRDISKRVW